MTDKKKFDIDYWLNKDNPAKEPQQKQVTNKDSKKHIETPTINDVEVIIKRLEESHTDITANYSDWRDIGFALAEEFGESERSYFHSVSRFYSEYSHAACDKQFDKCLKATGHGVTIKTFFHLAQQAGISLVTAPPRNTIDKPNKSHYNTKSESVEKTNEVTFNTPQIPSEIYGQLPEILQESANMFQDAVEKDVFLIGALSVISGCLPNIEGIYFDEPVSAHLYSFITAPAGSGKGKLKWTKYFGMKIHKSVVEQSNIAKEEVSSQ